MFNMIEDDVDVPDGDIEHGRKLYNELCAGSIYAYSAATTTSDLGPASSAYTAVRLHSRKSSPSIVTRPSA
jgi:hypothetical protein